MPLEYDNSAWYYFSMTMLTFYVMPTTYWAVGYTYRALTPNRVRKGEEVRTTLEKTKATELREHRNPKKILLTWFYVGNMLLLIAAWTVLIFLVYLVCNDSELAAFDPFLILGVDKSAEVADIRRAYRKLSLEFHPDKNLGNKGAEEMFMKVAKAYEALTDEESKKNWEEFGNPDGKQALEVSIGLPTFLLDEKNHYAILCIYLGVLVVVIPAIVAAWYSHSQKFGENNVMYETYSFFMHALSEHSTAKMLPEVLAGAAENRAAGGLAASSGMSGEIQSVAAQLRGGALMHKPRFEHPAVLRGNVLLHAHVNRLTLPTKAIKTELTHILANSPKLLDAMLELAQSQRWLQTSLSIIDFMQYLTQGLWVKDHSLAQLPHYGEKEVAHCTKGKGAVKTLKEYLAVPDEEKKGLAGMGDAQVADVMKVCKIMPDLNVKFEFYCEDEPEIAERDLVTLCVSFERRNVAPGAMAPAVHAPKFPVARLECWWVLVSDRAGGLVLAEKITGQGRLVEHRVKFVAPPSAGTYLFNIDLKSADYLGLDVRETLKMTVISAATLPEYVAHQDDLDLDDEPTLFEQVMSGAADDSSDDEDDEDEEGDEDEDEDAARPADAAGLTEAERRRRKARIQRKKSSKKKDDDDDSDSDDEDEDE